jgi:predicted acyltransferase
MGQEEPTSRVVSPDTFRRPASGTPRGGDSSASRVVSLDQFRGYTVLGMLLVNFAGGFRELPDTVRHHHTHFSYADSIMPQFFFAVGFALRLTLLRRWQEAGPWAAYGRALGRVVALLLFAVFYHGLSGRVKDWGELERLGVVGFLQTAFLRETFQTLTHIAVTSLWVLPVIAAGPLVRVGYAAASVALFWYLSQFHGYYHWEVSRPGIDGGPLGFLTWTVPLLAGSLAYDAIQAWPPRAVVGRLLFWGVVLMALGYGMSCLSRVLAPEPPASVFAEPPFVPPAVPKETYHAESKKPENAWHLFWVMSQRAGSPSYLVFGAGFALAVYAAFVLACDVLGGRLGVLDTFGANALAAYIIHDMVGNALRGYKPADAPWWYALLILAAYLGVCYVMLRYLEKRRLFLRL